MYEREEAGVGEENRWFRIVNEREEDLEEAVVVCVGGRRGEAVVVCAREGGVRKRWLCVCEREEWRGEKWNLGCWESRYTVGLSHTSQRCIVQSEVD
jgi:hypothetical protein